MTDIEKITSDRGYKSLLKRVAIAALILIAGIVALVINCFSAHAATPNEFEIVFEWEYTTQPDLTGFHLYQDGALLADIPDKATRTLTKKTILPNPRACFTMTAYGATEDMESPRSAEYCIKRPLAAPAMSLPKYYRVYIQAGPVQTSPVK